VVADNKNETVEELPDPDFEKLENTKSPNKNRKSSRSNLEHRFQCPYCESTSSQKYDMKKHVNFMHNDMFHSTDFSQILPIDIQNKAEKSVGIKHEAVSDSFSNKSIKLIYKPSQLKRTIGTVGTNIAIEVPSKVKKDDSNSEPYEDHEELIDPDFEKLENTESPNRNRKSSRSNLEHRFQCPYCDSIFTQKSSLQSHVSLKHEDLFCSTDFSQLLPIDDIKNVAEENIEKKNESSDETFKNKPIKLKKTLGNRFQCPYCTKIIKSNLRSHVNFMHNDQFKGTDFSQILPINAIQNKAEENVEMTQEPLNDSFSNKPIKLTYPHFDKNKSISKTEKLKRTIRTIDTNKTIEIPSKVQISKSLDPLSCDLCGAKFAQIKNLGRHFQTVHEKKISFPCSICGQVFGAKQTLERHLVKVHKLDLDESKKLAFSESDEGDTSHKKPYLSFAQLIAEALNNAPGKTLVLSDIYKAINAKYPYYKLENKGWQNSIRHNLTLNKYFIKGNKSSGFVGKDEKRGWYWKLSTDVPKALLETRQKYSANKRKCEFCHKDFETRLDLNQHIQESHVVECETSNADKQYKCDICNVFIAYHKSEIKLHRKSCENRKITKQVLEKDNVNKFFITNENGKEIFSCSKCGLTFSGFNGTHIINCWNIQSDKT